MDLVIHLEGAAACIDLTRAEKRNAISREMRSAIAAAIPTFARDPGVYALIIRSDLPAVFSAGGDIAELASAAEEAPDGARQLLAEEFGLNWLLECFSKPTVSLIDGLVMGSGVGISAYGTHRVAGERYCFAMPETGIGLFPDDGVAWVLARMPDHIGVYLGLTGRRIGRADAFRLGLVTHCIPAARFGEIELGLRAADPVDPLLDDRHEDPGPGEIDSYRDVLAHCFSGESVEDIMARLADRSARGDAAAGWCSGVLEDLNQRSPTSLKVTLRHIREAAARDLRQTLTIDYRLACQMVQMPDFREGVRALLIDKDRRPRWTPASVAEVSDAMIDRLFAYQGGRELVLPTRQEMQAARV